MQKNDIKISLKKIWLIKVTNSKSIDRSQLGPRLLIKFLQDAAGRGDLDPWDIDVISVIDSFLEQFNQNLQYSSNHQISYQKDLSETSEAFFNLSLNWSRKLSITLITSISHGSRSPLPAASWRNFINNLGPNLDLSMDVGLDSTLN